ncbi:MAG: helix-turn-helix domain-containing protein [Oscillibacter sp.]|nr:helix-turn-helix domain-containing protein [Oscillibacter sp.]
MICERIRETRERNGLTQAALAKKLGVTRSAVNSWEIGISAPSVQYLIELCKLFKVSADYLLELSSNETVDISFLDDEEKSMVYSFLEYFQKYGSTLRKFNRQVENDYDIIKRASEEATDKAVKNIMSEIMSIKEIFE